MPVFDQCLPLQSPNLPKRYCQKRRGDAFYPAMTKDNWNPTLLKLPNLKSRGWPDIGCVNRDSSDLLVDQLQHNIALSLNVVLGIGDDCLIIDSAGSYLETVQQRGIKPLARLRYDQREDVLASLQLAPNSLFNKGAFALHPANEAIVL